MTWGIANYSTTPASNTAINGTNIAPGCPSSSAGPFMRQIMADVAAALAAGQFVPAGAVFDFAAVAAPAGYLACDGSAVSRTTFAALFAVIGTTFGAGDGSTTFNLPDARGRVTAGYDAANATGRLNGSAPGVDASAIGHTGGEQAHALTTPELATHNHTVTITDNGHNHFSAAAATGANFVGGSSAVNSGGGASFIGPTSLVNAHGQLTSSDGCFLSVSESSVGSGTAHNNVQPTLVLLKCIKT